MILNKWKTLNKYLDIIVKLKDEKNNFIEILYSLMSGEENQKKFKNNNYRMNNNR